MWLIACLIAFDIFGHGKEIQSLTLIACWDNKQNAYNNDKAFHELKNTIELFLIRFELYSKTYNKIKLKLKKD